MKLSELLLFERLTAAVHINSDRTLHVISNLVQKEFGLNADADDIGLSCLLAALTFSMEAVSDIPANVIVDSLRKQNREFARGQKENDQYDGRSLTSEVFSLDELFNMIKNTTINHDGKGYQFNLGLKKYKLGQAISAVKSGQPVTVVIDVDSSVYDYIETESDDGTFTKNGYEEWVRKEARRDKPGTGRMHHSVLMIGYDSSSNSVILRDGRSKYLYKGFAKVEEELLKHPGFRTYMAFTVESMKEVEPKQEESLEIEKHIVPALNDLFKPLKYVEVVKQKSINKTVQYNRFRFELHVKAPNNSDLAWTSSLQNVVRTHVNSDEFKEILKKHDTELKKSDVYFVDKEAIGEDAQGDTLYLRKYILMLALSNGNHGN